MENDFSSNFIKNYVMNASLDPLDVKHSEMKFKDSEYRIDCIHCENGIIPIERDKQTLLLLTEAHCVQCGRRYNLIDLEENQFILTYKKN